MHSLPWTADRDGAHVARAAIYMSGMQAEAGFCCPMTMTFAAVPALQAQPEIAAEWVPKLMSRSYDPELQAARREGQRAVRHGDDREAGRLGRARQHDGRDAAQRRRRRRGVPHHRPQVVLLGADVRPLPRRSPRPTRASRCFAMPRILPDGTRNEFHLQRLKDKLGNRSNALERGRVPRRLGAHGRRARPRRPDDHRDGRPHAPGLRHRHRRRHARGRRPRDVAHGAPLRRSASCSSTSR